MACGLRQGPERAEQRGSTWRNRCVRWRGAYHCNRAGRHVGWTAHVRQLRARQHTTLVFDGAWCMRAVILCVLTWGLRRPGRCGANPCRRHNESQRIRLHDTRSKSDVSTLPKLRLPPLNCLGPPLPSHSRSSVSKACHSWSPSPSSFLLINSALPAGPATLRPVSPSMADGSNCTAGSRGAKCAGGRSGAAGAAALDC